jgi:hypothetical protein
VGFIVLRQAIDSGDRTWLNAELELLHNIPSLIDEPNLERHRYFWNTERPYYLESLKSSGNVEAESRMRTFYAPVWKEMEPEMRHVLQS